MCLPYRRAALAQAARLALLAPLWLGAAAASAQGEAPLKLRLAEELEPPARQSQAGSRSVVLRAGELRMRPELETVAEGDVEFRHAGTVLRTDRLTYDNADDLATARGRVTILRDGNRFSGPELKVQVQRFEGYFLAPEFELWRTGARGSAERIDFLDSSRFIAQRARYSSCTPDNPDGRAPDAAAREPDWLLAAERVKLDLETSEGVAEGAQLRFLGVPILALPVLSFPLSDARRSGWLPPNINLDSKSGLELGLPYYWNIAPNRDATLTPTVYSRRGLGLDSEFRYLEPRYAGGLNLSLLPDDRAAGRSRWAVQAQHEGQGWGGLDYKADLRRVSDDLYWKDFPSAVKTPTPRLLNAELGASRTLALGPFSAEAYGRLRDWQVLQTTDTSTAIVSPYQRMPQLGLRGSASPWPQWDIGFETEVNRFVLPGNSAPAVLADSSTALRPDGWRWHAQGSISRTWQAPGWWVRPKLSVNTAVYDTDTPMADGRQHAARTIPTFSVDAGMVFERDSDWFGRGHRQTLEPRLLYLHTPYRDQSALPKFDTAGRDFNMVSLFAENAFNGIDRVADAHQLTAGVSTRLLDGATGAEALRLGVAQRYLFRDQRITPGTVTTQGFEPEGSPYTQRLSDVLLEGSTGLIPDWRLDAGVQISADSSRTVRSILGARWSPGPFKTVSTTYRLARGLSEQLELGWQWPVYRGRAEGSAGGGGGRCQGSLYAVGRINYSMKDSRVTDSIAGFEYDAGCWIARVVGERLSTGRTEATTRLLLQLELVGLSRLGSNPLKVLKDNIPGYQLLREDRDSNPSVPIQ